MGRLSRDVFFDIDREAHDLAEQPLPSVSGDGGPSEFNDAALVKTLLFLLVETLFHGSHWGPKDKDNLELWQTLLTAAAKEELE